MKAFLAVSFSLPYVRGQPKIFKRANEETETDTFKIRYVWLNILSALHVYSSKGTSTEICNTTLKTSIFPVSAQLKQGLYARNQHTKYPDFRTKQGTIEIFKVFSVL